MFWIVAISVLVATGLYLGWPLLARGSTWKATGLAVLLALPLGGALLYQNAGTPAALDAAVMEMDSTDFNSLADNLRGRLGERPEDLEGWLLLGRSLKSLQRYDEALEALETARRIAPDSPMVKVELAEARLFASGNPRISEDVRELLQSAVEQEPGLQKGLWLLGIDAAQRGDDEQAIEYWQRLLSEVGADTPVAESVQEQIDLARGRLGMDPLTPSDEVSAWPGVTVEVDLGNEATAALAEPLPRSAVLFVIVRPGGEAAGPPLGVARVDAPSFPIEITVDDRHAMMPQRRLSEQPKLRFMARLSLTGSPGANAGDWESTPVAVAAESPEPISLALTTRVE